MNNTEPAPDQLSAAELLTRWDVQQSAYIRYRNARFLTMIQMLKLHGTDTPRILDLACGPGSLTKVIREHLPGTTVISVDKDPVLLALAASVFSDDDKVKVVQVDLDQESWVNRIEGPFDAVLSSTALHWLRPEVLTRVYWQLADLIRPGGIFMNADHLKYDIHSQPTLHRFANDDDQNQQESMTQQAESWDAWWKIVNSVPQYQALAAEREKVWEDHNSSPLPKVTLGLHLEALKSAGFTEVGTVWQYLDDYVLAALR